MASKKKEEREIVRWVTVKGKHMPIYADGSFGVGKEDDSIDDETTTKETKKLFEHKTEFGKQMDNEINNYQSKFLTKRSNDEIKELKSNLDKSTKIVGTTEQDQIAYAAIERELESRKSKSADVKATEAILSKETAQGVGRLKEKYSKNTSRIISKNAKYDTSRSKKKKPSSLEAFKENARQFESALNEATKQGALEVEFIDITGKTFKRWWNGGSWSDRKIVQDMAKRYSKKSGTFKSSFKKPKDWE